jgi:hypothetical protein
MENIYKTINAARISKVHDLVIRNNRQNPYLLLPLRLETHFREADVPTYPQHEVEILDILKMFKSVLDVTRLVNKSNISVLESEKFYSLPKTLHDLEQAILHLDVISAEDKEAIVNTAGSFINTLQRSIPRVHFNRLFPYCEKILKASETVMDSSILKENRASRFLNKMQGYGNSLNTLSEEKHATYKGFRRYRNARNTEIWKKEENKRLYQYMTGRLIKIIYFFKNAGENFDKLPALDSFQRQRILKMMGYDKKEIRRKIRKGIIFSGEDYRSTFRKKLDKIESNIKKFYANSEFVDDFRKRKLMEVYNERWKKKIDEARQYIITFEKKILCDLEKKKYRSFNYTRLSGKLLKLNMSLYMNRERHLGLRANELKVEIDKLCKLAKDTHFDIKEESDFCQQLLSELIIQAKEYLQLRFDKGDPDYLNISENDALIASLNIHIPVIVNKIGKVKQKQLCVRIFPDEIFINQFDEMLTKEEATDAKKFWLQWYIASDNPTREYEAWTALCAKYDVLRASWIVRQLRPPQLKQNLTQRPYLNAVQLEALLDEIVASMSGLFMSADDPAANESKIRLAVENNLLPKVNSAQNILIKYEKVVDYLFQHTEDTLLYVDRRIEALKESYEQNPLFGERKPGGSWNADYAPLINLQNTVRSLLNTITPKSISLDDLIEDYLKRFESGTTGFFPVINQYREPNQFSVPTSPILPDRFLFFGDTLISNSEGKKFKKRIVYAGRKVKNGLHLGFDPNEDSEIDPYSLNKETGDIDFRGGARWMTDYETAVGSGMAISVPLPHTDAEFRNAKFLSIYVLGIKDCKDKNETELLEQLINGHIYGGTGLDLLKIGTPTNNFDDVVSGFNSDDALIEEQRYGIEVGEIFRNKKNDASRLAEYLGLDYNETFGRIVSFDNQEIKNASDINRLMWQLMDHNEILHLKTLNDFIARIPAFITNYCIGRGILPPMRIGSQPYGILPTTAFSRFELDPSANTDSHSSRTKTWDSMFKFGIWLMALLKRIDGVWSELRDEVICSENLSKEGSKYAQGRFTEMMGLTPTSVAFFERTMMRAKPILFEEFNYQEADKKFDVGKILNQIFFVNSNTHASGRSAIEKIPFFSYHPIGTLVKELVSDTEGMPYDLASLFKEAGEKVFKGNVNDRALWEKFTETLNTKEELDRRNMLFAEFFDLFTHRIDAWWLGLVNYQREKMCSKSIKLGAFGWLVNLERKQKTKIPAGSNLNKICSDMKISNDKPLYRDTKSNEYILAPSVNQAITAAVLKSSYNNSRQTTLDSNLCINLTSSRVRQALRLIDGMRSGLSVGAILGIDLERGLHEAYKFDSILEMDRYIYPLREMFPLKIEIGRAHV